MNSSRLLELESVSVSFVSALYVTTSLVTSLVSWKTVRDLSRMPCHSRHTFSSLQLLVLCADQGKNMIPASSFHTSSMAGYLVRLNSVLLARGFKAMLAMSSSVKYLKADTEHSPHHE